MNELSANNNVLEIRNLDVTFQTMDGPVHAVRDVSLTLKRGQTLAVVGESGSGKSVTSYAILRLIQSPGRITGGQVMFRPANGAAVDVAALAPRDAKLYAIRGGQISMIFQEPMTALSPVHTVGNQICEAIRLHRRVTQAEAQRQAVAMLDRVGIPEPERRLKQYPFEFSGGMRQRVVIAMALVCQPEILIADEPTTALDVTIQAQILELINELRRELGTSVIFITHDLGVVAQVADEVAVMEHGRVVEKASVHQLFAGPYHPYTKRLLAAIPGLQEEPERLARMEAASPPESLPSGLSLDPLPGSALGPPLSHRFSDGREVLVWPTSEKVIE